MYRTLAISLTQKCNAKCEMCCFSCGPNKTMNLSKDEVFRLIDQCEGTTIKTISFSGGEAFLDIELLMESIDHAKSKGFNVSVISNGFWGRNKARATTIAKRLKDLKLDELSLSIDEFHQHYIPINSIKNILEITREFNIPTSVGFGITKKYMAGKFIDELAELLINTRITIYPIIPVGDAKINLNQDDYFYMNDVADMHCPNRGIMSILFDKNFYPCCSQVILDANLDVANINDTSVSEAIALCQSNIYLFIMKHKSLTWYYNVIKENNLADIPEVFATTCDFCQFLFSNDGLLQKIKPFVEQEINEIIKNKK